MRKQNIIILIIVSLLLAVLSFSFLFGQADTPPAANADQGNKGINFVLDDEAVETRKLFENEKEPLVTKSLYKVVVDTFEDAGEWFVKMPNEQGLVVSRRMPGVPWALKNQGTGEALSPPKGKNPPSYRKEDGTYERNYYVPTPDEKKYVLGVRVDFQKRGHNWFGVYPYRPIQLKGVVKALEVWVCGRQKNHELYIIVDDIFGNERLIPVGKLNFLGWKRLYVHVPDKIIQYDYRFTEKRGILFKGFLIKCDPVESWGRYYIYFDNLTAEVSRFWEEYQDQKDPVDSW